MAMIFVSGRFRIFADDPGGFLNVLDSARFRISLLLRWLYQSQCSSVRPRESGDAPFQFPGKPWWTQQCGHFHFGRMMPHWTCIPTSRTFSVSLREFKGKPHKTHDFFHIFAIKMAISIEYRPAIDTWNSKWPCSEWPQEALGQVFGRHVLSPFMHLGRLGTQIFPGSTRKMVWTDPPLSTYTHNTYNIDRIDSMNK